MRNHNKKNTLNIYIMCVNSKSYVNHLILYEISYDQADSHAPVV